MSLRKRDYLVERMKAPKISKANVLGILKGLGSQGVVTGAGMRMIVSKVEPALIAAVVEKLRAEMPGVGWWADPIGRGYSNFEIRPGLRMSRPDYTTLNIWVKKGMQT